jgi:hypothetical protein
VPADVGSELPQDERRERSRADAVDVVVTVDADSFAFLDCFANPLDRDGHVTEEHRVVPRELRVEEPPGRARIDEPPPGEHSGGHVAHAQLSRERKRFARIKRGHRPGARHSQ